jgi:hypothetical protein
MPVHTSSQACKSGENRLTVPAINREGRISGACQLNSKPVCVFAGWRTVLSVVKNVADDLRYGFYTSFGKLGETTLLKRICCLAFHVTAVEFYDYFAGHGYYAPR